MKKKPCKILCTQPRRIAAIAAADRVSYERNEETGKTVGYQVRLESDVDPSSNCVFLTPGVFLRYLTCGEPRQVFNSITHIIVDEAHERAKENDFLLTSIKEHFSVNPDLKLIIMSATMETSIFANYFDNNCDSISIATRQFNVEEIYLEDILKHVNFTNKRVEELNEMHQKGELTAASSSSYINELSNKESSVQSEDVVEIDENTAAILNETIDGLNNNETFEESLNQLMYLVQSENLPIDFRHAQTKMTALMICVGRAAISSVEILLSLGANPRLKIPFSETEIDCLDIAYRLYGSDSEVFKVLQEHLDKKGSRQLNSDEIYDKALLNIYYDTRFTTKKNNFVVEESTDHNLIVDIIGKIHCESPIDFGILCFLPGFDDIIQVEKNIRESLKNETNYELFMLHSSMKTEDQKSVFKLLKQKRKIILATNIAESSITVPDVVYVIDSGREKSKTYDSLSHSSSLKVQWISKASANQRKGRAGRMRDGFVFRVYSKDRYNSMLNETIPELLRNSISEICLQSKLLVGESVRIEEFLGRCIAKPSQVSIRQSIKLLQSLGALDKDEQLTAMGRLLAAMPVDARYGKMIIYSIVFRCIDPVISIVSILSMSDQVFILPVKPSDRYKCLQLRRGLAGNSMSDHHVMLKIFDMWLEMKRNKMNEWRFCEENFINTVVMERSKGVRGQILSYLESSGLLNAQKNKLNRNSKEWSVIKSCLCAGLYPNIAKIDKRRKELSTEIDSKLLIHMASVIGNKNEKSLDYIQSFPGDWILFEEKNRIGRIAMIKCNTLINNFCVSITAGSSLQEELIEEVGNWGEDETEVKLERNEMYYKIDNNITFCASTQAGHSILHIREKLDNLITKFLDSPSVNFSEYDENLIETISKLLAIEDRHSGFEETQMNFSATSQQVMQRNHVKPLFRGPSTSSSSNPSSFYNEQTRIQKQRKKFFVTKINDFQIDFLNRRRKCEVEDLRLHGWLMNQIYHPKMVSVQICIFFYSPSSDDFLFFGDVQPAEHRNHSKIFLLKSSKKFPLSEIRQKFFFRNFQVLQDSRFQTEEIEFNTGNALIDIVHSS